MSASSAIAFQFRSRPASFHALVLQLGIARQQGACRSLLKTTQGTAKRRDREGQPPLRKQAGPARERRRLFPAGAEGRVHALPLPPRPGPGPVETAGPDSGSMEND